MVTITLSEFLSRANANAIQRGDYIYQHDDNSELNHKNMDFTNLYFVIGNTENGLEIHNYLSDETKCIYVTTLVGYWWVFKLDPLQRKALHMD
jgi:hypothetical protein